MRRFPYPYYAGPMGPYQPTLAMLQAHMLHAALSDMQEEGEPVLSAEAETRIILAIYEFWAEHQMHERHMEMEYRTEIICLLARAIVFIVFMLVLLLPIMIWGCVQVTHYIH